MHFALLRQSQTSQDALTWLDEARKTTWTSRFTVRESDDEHHLKWVMSGRRDR